MSRESSNANVAPSDMVESTFGERKARIADAGLFFKKFLAKGKQISSAVPSSPVMVANMVSYIDFTKPGTIVELGAGTGPVTEQILENLKPFHRFVVVENDPDFCEILRRRFPETTLLQADAGRITEPLANLGIHKVDYVLSGLPTPNLPRRAQAGILRWLRRSLAPEGLFIQLTVVPLLYRGFYRRIFEAVDYRMVWLNIPPGGVYCCGRPKGPSVRSDGGA
ncbi:MAG: rRNA adenine N-6-methyltransferase family protein [Planctomycetota bacterium]